MVEGLTSLAADPYGQPAGSAASRGRRMKIIPSSRTIRSGADHIITSIDPGDFSGEATPVPIPNTEVKLSSAEDTERAAFRENRSSPGFLRFRGSTQPLTGSAPTRCGLCVLGMLRE